MKNGTYTVFGRKKSDPEWADSLLFETPSKEVYERNMAKAKELGYIVTRVYKPDTVLSAPNFAACVNV